MEGYVVRILDSFPEEDFSKSIAKWVRPNHIQRVYYENTSNS